MSKTNSNVGQTGIDSIRLGGKTIEQLNFVELAHANLSMPLVHSNEKQANINNVLAKYPKHSVNYITARIKECEENVKRIDTVKKQQQAMMSEYNMYIGLCEHRDREIARLDPEKDAEIIKDLKKRMPPYNVEEMKKQMGLCTDAIERCDQVIAREYTSIAELREVMGLCLQRDAELRGLGAPIVT